MMHEAHSSDISKVQENGSVILKSQKSFENVDNNILNKHFEVQQNQSSNTERMNEIVHDLSLNTKENISVQEAHKLNIPTYGIVDTNSDPNKIDFAIPANDDSSKSVDLILRVVCEAIAEGLEERKALKGTKKDEDEKEGVVAEATKATEEIAGEE